MSQEFLASGGPILFVMALIALVLDQWLTRHLRKYHPPTYESLGSPRLFGNNGTPRHRWLRFKFLFRSEFNRLDDPALSIVCRIMQVYFCAFLVVFLFFFAAMLLTTPAKLAGRV